MSRPRFNSDTQDWYDRADKGEPSYGCTRLKAARGAYLLTGVTDWSEPREPRAVIVGSGKLSFRLTNHVRSALPNICVAAREVGGRIGWEESQETTRLLFGRPGGKPCAETGGSFAFSVKSAGDQEVHTTGQVVPTNAAQPPEPSVQSDPPAQSTFVCRVAAESETGYAAFLCHASCDHERVLEFAKRLKNAGIRYWLDSEQIGLGDPVAQNIERGLESSRDLVVCLSRQTKRSGWVRAEYAAVLARVCAGDGARSVIPVLLEEVDDASFPALLFDRLRVDLRDDASLSKLIERLSRKQSFA